MSPERRLSMQSALLVIIGILQLSNSLSAQVYTEQDLTQPDPSSSDTIVRYRALITDLEVEHGPYHDSLSEPLISLGRVLKSSGQHPDAQAALLRAQRNIRINNGLYNPAQIPIVNLLIESSAATGDWEEVDDNYHQLMWLHERAYQHDSQKLLQQIKEQINWHITAVNFTSGKQSADHLLEVRELYGHGLQILQDNNSQESTVLAQWLYKQILTDFYIAIAIRKGRESGHELIDALATQDVRFGYMASAEALIEEFYDDGLDVFERITGIYTAQPGYSVTQLATLYIYQADWNLLFNKPEKALELYEISSRMLLQTGIPEASIESYFSRPVALPVQELILDYPLHADLIIRSHLYMKEREMIQQVADVTANSPLYLGWSDELPGVGMPVSGLLDFARPNTEQHGVAVFNVAETGWPENIDILSHFPETFVTRNRAYNTVWSIQFRPVIEAGKTIRVTDATLSFVIPE